MQNTDCARDIGAMFHSYSGCKRAVLGRLEEDFIDHDGKRYRQLLPRKPNEMVYDCTHDNPTPVQKLKTARIALS